MEVAVAFAKRRNPVTNVSVFDFVRDLLLRYPDAGDEAYRRDQQMFVQKFQQFTAPVMAKGVEDTAFYRYHRLVSHFAVRERTLADLEAQGRAGHLGDLADDLVTRWPDGRVKLYTIHRALALRRARAALFQRGAYVPLQVLGSHAAHVCAFARQLGTESVVVVVPRLVAKLTGHGSRLPLGGDVWADTRVLLTPELAGPRIQVFTGEAVPAVDHGAEAALAVGDLLNRFPVALLEPARARGAGPDDPRLIGSW